MRGERLFYALIVVGILAILSAGIYAAISIPANDPGHNSTQVFVSYPGGYVSLQNVIDNNYLASSSPSISSYATLPISTPYHLASKILITTRNGYSMTFQEAVSHNVFITGASQSYTTILPAGGEYATHIKIANRSGILMSFQEGITQNGIGCVPKTCSALGFTCGTLSDGCGGTLNCGTCAPHYTCSNNGGGTCLWTCTASPLVIGTACYPSGTSPVCMNPGTIQCDGTCGGYSYYAAGTQSSCSADTSCYDGNCVGWSGSGAGSCDTCPYPYAFTSGDDRYCTMQYSYATGGGHGTNWQYQGISTGGSSTYSTGAQAVKCSHDNKNCPSVGPCTITSTDHYTWHMKYYSITSW
jgi:hypothetical protein